MTFRVLVTGFGPFPGVLENPSATIARSLAGSVVGGADVTGVVLDVAWDDGLTSAGSPVRSAAGALAEAVERARPHVLLSVGVMPREARKLRIETRACDARAQRVDVCDRLPATARAHPDGAAVLMPKAPAEAIARELAARGHAVELSQDAGKYLCEAVAYEGARLCEAGECGLLVSGFLHVPNGAAIEPLIAAAIVFIERCLAELSGHAPRG